MIIVKLFWPLSTHQPMGVLLIDECILRGAMSITSSQHLTVPGLCILWLWCSDKDPVLKMPKRWHLIPKRWFQIPKGRAVLQSVWFLCWQHKFLTEQSTTLVMFNCYIMYYGMELNLTGKKMLGNCYCDGFIWSIYHHFLHCFFF